MSRRLAGCQLALDSWLTCVSLGPQPSACHSAQPRARISRAVSVPASCLAGKPKKSQQEMWCTGGIWQMWQWGGVYRHCRNVNLFQDTAKGLRTSVQQEILVCWRWNNMAVWGEGRKQGWRANQKVYVRVNGVCDLEGTKDLGHTAVAENLKGVAAILLCVNGKEHGKELGVADKQEGHG